MTIFGYKMNELMEIAVVINVFHDSSIIDTVMVHVI